MYLGAIDLNILKAVGATTNCCFDALRQPNQPTAYSPHASLAHRFHVAGESIYLESGATSHVAPETIINELCTCKGGQVVPRGGQAVLRGGKVVPRGSTCKV